MKIFIKAVLETVLVIRRQEAEALKTIAEQIKSGDLSRFHLIYGEEPYMVRYYKNKLKRMLSQEGDDMNVSSFEGNGIPWRKLVLLEPRCPFLPKSV